MERANTAAAVPVVVGVGEPDGLADRLRPYRAAGARIEFLAPSRTGEEYLHLGDGGELIHRLSPERGLLTRRLSPARGSTWAARYAEKLFELRRLWNRDVVAVVTDGEMARLLGALPGLRSRLGAAPGPAVAPPPPAGPVRSAELVCCTYNRITELLDTLPSLLREVTAARAHRVDCVLTVVPQNADTEERLYALRPQWRGDDRLRFSLSSPPSLPRARNHAARRSTADVVIYVDDDVEADPGFVAGYVTALEAAPRAIGAAGRVRSRINGEMTTRDRSVGQIRLSGYVETHFESVYADEVLVPMTPIGCNMAYRRERMNAVLGQAWFDEGLTGSAHREETTTAVKLFRRGEHLVHAPLAGLLHLEAMQGGCETRAVDDARQTRQYALEYLFLNRLYPGALRAFGPLWFTLRDLRIPEHRGERLRRLSLNLKGYVRGRRMFREAQRR